MNVSFGWCEAVAVLLFVGWIVWMIGHQFGVAWAILQAGRGSRSDATQHFHICLRGHLTSGIWCHERVGGKWIRHMDFLLTLYPMQPGISLGVSGQVYFTEIHFHGAVFHNLLTSYLISMHAVKQICTCGCWTPFLSAVVC